MTPSWTISLHGNDVTVAFDSRADAEAFVERADGMDLTPTPNTDQPEGVGQTIGEALEIAHNRAALTTPTPASGEQIATAWQEIIRKALLAARNQGRDEGLGDMEESIAGPAAWLDRWAKHVGSCQGGDRCTCGLTLARVEIATALRKSQGEKE